MSSVAANVLLQSEMEFVFGSMVAVKTLWYLNEAAFAFENVSQLEASYVISGQVIGDDYSSAISQILHIHQ